MSDFTRDPIRPKEEIIVKPVHKKKYKHAVHILTGQFNKFPFKVKGVR